MKKNIINKKFIFFLVSVLIFIIIVSWKLNTQKKVSDDIKVKAAEGTYRKKVSILVEEEATPTVIPLSPTPTIILPTIVVSPVIEILPSPTSKPIEVLPESGNYMPPIIIFSASLLLIVVSFIF